MPVASGLKILDYLAQESFAVSRVPPRSRTVQLRCRASTFWFVSKLNMSIGGKFNTDKIELRLFR